MAAMALLLWVPGCEVTEQTADPTAVTQEQTGELTAVTLMLDWVPNVNHTGIFVAQEKGYFEEAGLEVEIAEPGEVFAEQAVASDAVEFGISFQEQLTLARVDNIPLVSIAAIIQHNTSGFASRGGANIQSPADWAGLRYGSFGTPFEAPTLQALMECAGGNFSQLEIVDTALPIHRRCFRKRPSWRSSMARYCCRAAGDRS
jgi:ABC-type nitrate/sulfonate/bicarbonate transport system substrate-binding protein